MRLSDTTKLQQIEWGILAVVFILTILGIATLYSLQINQEIPNFSLPQHQITAAFLGFGALVLFLFLDFRYLKDFAYFFYIIGILLLIVVLFFGEVYHGTKGWFRIVDFTFQPVELFKIIFIIALSKFYAANQNINQPLTLLKSFGFLIIPAVFIYRQPDLGSLIILVVIWLGYLLMMKLKPIYFVFLFLLLIAASVFSWQFVFASYQKQRIISFVNPSIDLKGSGYNVQQSKIAIGSGQIWGRGLGLGTQSSLNFLPEQETDFIFAVIAESLGFAGAILVILLYGFLLWRILNLSSLLKDEFAILVYFGVFFWFAFQGLSNIAMNLGLAPVFGVPLPFLSYGGSSLFVGLIAIGVLESIYIFSPREVKE